MKTALLVLAYTVLFVIGAFGVTLGYFEILYQHAFEPRDISSAADGSAWFTDADKIGHVALDGGISEQQTRDIFPSWLAVSNDGSVWFTSTVGAALGHRDPKGRIVTWRVAEVGGDLQDVGAVDSAGRLWFVKQFSRTISRIGPDGRIFTFRLPKNVEYGPTAIAIGQGNVVWFAAGRYIGQMTMSGKVIRLFPVFRRGHDSTSIVLGADQNLWFTDHGANAIGKIEKNGAIRRYTLPNAPPVSTVDRLLTGPRRSLLLVQYGQSTVRQIAAAGQITTISLAGSTGEGVATSPDGSIWYTLRRARAIGHRGPDTTVRTVTIPRTLQPISDPHPFALALIVGFILTIIPTLWIVRLPSLRTRVLLAVAAALAISLLPVALARLGLILLRDVHVPLQLQNWPGTLPFAALPSAITVAGLSAVALWSVRRAGEPQGGRMLRCASAALSAALFAGTVVLTMIWGEANVEAILWLFVPFCVCIAFGAGMLTGFAVFSLRARLKDTTSFSSARAG